MGDIMNTKETTNVILGLRAKGWDDTEISNFLMYIETHNPTEIEVQESIKNRK